MPPLPSPAVPIRSLSLQHGRHSDDTLYRFGPPCRLRITPGDSLLGRTLLLYTNYPATDGSEEAAFERSRYRLLQWRGASEGRAESDPAGPGAPAESDPAGPGAPGTALLVDGRDVHCDLLLTRPGAYHYYFVYDTNESGQGPAGSGWFQVEPRLTVGGAPLPLDAVACQTVVTRCLGPLPRWEAVLRGASEAGYNMVHLTPVHARGGSGSAYCLADRLRPDPSLAGDWPQLHATLRRLDERLGLAAVCDVVLNHTANETPWLAAHPEATYNCGNCPHLRPAALLDGLVAAVARDAARGRLGGVQPAPARPQDGDLRAAVREVERRAAAARLHEFFQCDAASLQRRFESLAADRLPPPVPEGGSGPGAPPLALQPDGAPPLALQPDGAPPLALQPDGARRRLAAGVDMERALRLYNVRRADCADGDEAARVAACGAELRRALDGLNAAAAAELAGHLRAAADNLLAGARYERLQADGPRLGALTAAAPLFPRYFAWPEPEPQPESDPLALEALEALLWGAGGAAVRAHNGWVMDADPLQDFAAAAAGGRVYLRRELLAWGDSVKLRYGAAPRDSPFLWRHMEQYVRRAAALFAGVRLDNCHSTPLAVAEHMLDAARQANPHLYVVAELFTNAPAVDNVFVNRLGITALIREAQSAWDSREQGRLLHRFGGPPVGAFLRGPVGAVGPEGAVGPVGAVWPAVARLPRALLLDQTHDNPASAAVRSVRDLLPTAALLAMGCCATGSTRGYDDLVPAAVSVVSERRLYREWAGHVGITAARRELNRLHCELARDGYCEMFVDQMTADVVAVTRHEPTHRRSVVLVAATVFAPPSPGAGYAVPPLRFEGRLVELVLEAELRWEGPGGEPPSAVALHAPHPDYVDGLPGYRCHVRRRVPLADCQWVGGARLDGGATELAWRGPLPPGAVLAVRVEPLPGPQAALRLLRPLLEAPLDGDPLGLGPLLEPLEPVDFNALLYCCDAEERDGGGGGVYAVPGHGPLVYAGLQGAAALLDRLRPGDELGHALCANLRDGDWLAEHTWRRLEARGERLRPLADAYRAALQPLARLPRFLQPCYFDAVLRRLLAAVQSAALRRLSAGGGGGGEAARGLALCSLQLVGAAPSAPLPRWPPLPAARASLAAGLPHFATGHMRCWGRDTFVALRGLLLLPGRWPEAAAHLLAYGACLRHGLVPNLLDGGARARYNSRDALWWWLHALMQYSQAAPDGPALLHAPVPRLFPADDAPAPAPDAALPTQPLHEIVQEALQAHFEGRVFRERNAGPQLDAHMSDEGFTVTVGVDPDTGFVFGGNDSNCGTWMDKMGSSERAGTRGKPATPRDGSAVELVALCHAAVAWLAGEHAAGRYPHGGVSRPAPHGARTAWTWRLWADRIARNFERHFWVPAQPSAADARPDLVHRRAIYKDTVGATRPWADYQLRCNYALAMAASPALFDPQHAWAALDMVERHLLGGAGLRTLDPGDWAYRPRYEPGDDGPDPSTAHGYNYHQGPQWVWPLGAYLRARLAFGRLTGQAARARSHCLRTLSALLPELRTSPWRSLPELAHGDGAACEASCRAQAWSCATVHEALHALAAPPPSCAP